MRKRVAVETQLSGVRHALEEKGYEVVQLDPLSPSGAELKNVEAVVITGQDENMMGMEDLQTAASVIDARGMTANDIVAAVEAVENRARR